VIIDLSAANAGLPNLPSTHDDNAPAFLPEAERQTSAEKEVLYAEKPVSGTRNRLKTGRGQTFL